MVIYGRGGDRCEHARATDDLGQVSDRCGLLGVVSGDHPTGQDCGGTGLKVTRGGRLGARYRWSDGPLYRTLASGN